MYKPQIVKDGEYFLVYAKEDQPVTKYAYSLDDAFDVLHKMGFTDEEIEVVEPDEDYTRTFMIPVKIIFDGTVTVKAKEGEEAEAIVLDNFVCNLGNCTPNNENIIGWDISLKGFPEIEF